MASGDGALVITIRCHGFVGHCQSAPVDSHRQIASLVELLVDVQRPRVASLANAAGADTVSGSFAEAGTKFLRAPTAPDLANIAIRVFNICGDWRSEHPAPAKIATMC